MKKKQVAPVKVEPKDPIKEERLHSFRKEVSEIFVLNVKNIKTQEVLFSRAEVLDVSPSGLLWLVKRDEIVALSLRSTLTMSLIHDVNVGFTIEVMDNYIEGVIKRSKPRGGGEFLIAVDFSQDAPEYWRESLVDLLPGKEGFASDLGDGDEEDEDSDTNEDDLDEDDSNDNDSDDSDQDSGED